MLNDLGHLRILDHCTLNVLRGAVRRAQHLVVGVRSLIVMVVLIDHVKFGVHFFNLLYLLELLLNVSLIVPFYLILDNYLG